MNFWTHAPGINRRIRTGPDEKTVWRINTEQNFRQTAANNTRLRGMRAKRRLRSLGPAPATACTMCPNKLVRLTSDGRTRRSRDGTTFLPTGERWTRHGRGAYTDHVREDVLDRGRGARRGVLGRNRYSRRGSRQRPEAVWTFKFVGTEYKKHTPFPQQIFDPVKYWNEIVFALKYFAYYFVPENHQIVTKLGSNRFSNIMVYRYFCLK